jgi:phosphate butyryltransferase
MITGFEDIFKSIEEYPRVTVAIAVADNQTAIEAARMALEKNIATPLLVGDGARIEKMASEAGLDLGDVEVVNEPDYLKAAMAAVQAVKEERAQVLMKGQIHTDDFLRAVLNRDNGLRAGVIMSHCFLVELPKDNRLAIVTDGAMNIAPDLVQKAQIVLNAVYLAECLGMTNPRVGILAAVELVNPSMPATLDAAILATMDRRGQFPTCRLDGPFALDNAISTIAAEVKGISGDVAGRCDILVAPNIEAGNILAKSFGFLADGETAGILIGAKAPVVLTSRADSASAKLNSLALAVYVAGIERNLRIKVGKVHF